MVVVLKQISFRSLENNYMARFSRIIFRNQSDGGIMNHNFCVEPVVEIKQVFSLQIQYVLLASIGGGQILWDKTRNFLIYTAEGNVALTNCFKQQP